MSPLEMSPLQWTKSPNFWHKITPNFGTKSPNFGTKSLYVYRFPRLWEVLPADADKDAVIYGLFLFINSLRKHLLVPGLGDAQTQNCVGINLCQHKH